MKTVIVTGANSGLGYACAKEIASHGDWHIVLACRDLTKAENAANKLREITSGDRLEVMELDLASLDSIRNFTVELRDRTLDSRYNGGHLRNALSRDLPTLGAIVCNAGVQFINRQTYTQDGFETTFGVNHLGHFLLVNLLLSQLATPARIVVVSSDTHDRRKTTGMPEPYFRDPQLMAYPQSDPALKDKSTGELGRIAYTTSKLCNVLFAYELDRRLQQQNINNITVNVFNPGLMPGSGLAQDYTATAKFVWNNILPILSRFVPNVNTIDNAGKALARLVLDPELENTTGKYFSGFQAIDSSPDSYNLELARQLWESSIELTRLDNNLLSHN